MDSVFFVLSKLYWLVGGPDSLLLILLSFAVLIACWRQRFGMLLTVLTLFWCVAIFPLGNLLLYPLETRFADLGLPTESEISGVIVLGGPEHMTGSVYWEALEVNEAAERLLAMNNLLQHYTDIPFIYTSGSASLLNQEQKGADVVKRYFDGLEGAEQIIYERQSRNTYENALYSKALMPSQNKSWLLVTSAFHMPRSVGVFRHQQVDVIPYAVDHWSMPPSVDSVYFDFSSNLSNLKMGVREWTGLIAYRLAGRTDAWFPGPDDLAKHE